MRLSSPAARAPGLLLLPALLLSTALLSTQGAAQTAPAQPQPAPAQPATPAPATTTPAPARAPLPGAASAATARAASAIAVEVGSVIKGQIVACPAALKLSVRAVCLYSKNTPASLRPLIRGKLASRALGDWKTTGTTSTLLASETVNGPVGAFVLLRGLSATESLVAIDAAAPSASTAARPATPAGVVKGQPYVLGRDLIGVVNVTALGANKYRLNAGDSALTVTVGAKAAQLSGGQTTAGSVELPFAPATDGKNLIFPLLGLRSLGCTVTPAGATVTVACGQSSIGLRPIVF